MSVHYRHIQRIQLADNYHPHPNSPSQLKTRAFRSRIHRHHPALANTDTVPDYNNNPSIQTTNHSNSHPLASFELVILLLALSILVALVCWLLWLMLEYCLAFAREQLNDLAVGRRARQDRYRGEQARPGKRFSLSESMEKMGLGNVAEIAGAIFGSGEGGNSKKLLDDRGAGGYSEYGYRGGVVHPSNHAGGEERPTYSTDATSESSGCAGPMHGHREECVGECTLQTRRRSRES
ncbi:uncharacterized protein L3040_007974 [Drepanopeziza brunnea f. sp. 'multigermtubi']|uniref:uncharacterized protein n=1 Tax=Drepanopeziza brunnea f. sp. 'multigermtubi' TaxID=698441 RepID=UPI0023884ABC|nr:hypothetical protein L3040_007974 [Drepanopeziza brunnea f. sp. 'multigermtubi']